MERVNSLCRILIVCALSLLIGVGVLNMLPQSNTALQAEATLAQQIYEIQTALNEDHKEKIILFEEGCLRKTYSDAQLDKMINAWVKKAAEGRTYSEKALDSVKQEIISLYKKQQEIAGDPIYTTVCEWIYFTSAAVLIACNLNIIFVHRKQRKQAKSATKSAKTENEVSNNTDDFSKIENIKKDNVVNPKE